MAPKFVTTQKYESLACETVIAPAPIAIVTSVALIGLANPSAGSSGATIPAVVVSATVDEPCALFKIAESKNGNNIPIVLKTSA